MRRIKGLKSLIFDAVEETTNLVERTHENVAKKSVRRFAPIEPLATPARAVQKIHGTIASIVYSNIRGVNRLVEKAVDLGSGIVADNALVVTGKPEGATPLRSDSAGSFAWLVDHAEGALNGVVGDYLNRRENDLDLGMSIRHQGRILPVERSAFEKCLPGATGKVVVFVHGLGCTEWEWSLFAQEYYGDPAVNFGSLLEKDLGYTPLYVRYNTGRHVSESGRNLSQLLSEMFEAYPRKVKDLILIGHSMGGLVVRSAAHYAAVNDEPWVRSLSHVFCLAAPNLGAPLEKAANLLSSVLRIFDTAGTQVPAQILDTRSAGIKDMRFGYTVDDEWKDRHPDALLEDNRMNVPFVEKVAYYFVAATVTQDPAHPLGQLVGDLLVRLPSATGNASEPARRIPFSSGSVIGGMNHFHLANHPVVYEVLRRNIKAGRPPSRRRKQA